MTQIKHLKITQVSKAVTYHFFFQAVFTVVSHGNLNQERQKTRWDIAGDGIVASVQKVKDKRFFKEPNSVIL